MGISSDSSKAKTWTWLRKGNLKRNMKSILIAGGACGVMVGGARGVMVIVVENGHGNTSSNPGRG